jgi:hypothetical protein
MRVSGVRQIDIGSDDGLSFMLKVALANPLNPQPVLAGLEGPEVAAGTSVILHPAGDRRDCARAQAPISLVLLFLV